MKNSWEAWRTIYCLLATISSRIILEHVDICPTTRLKILRYLRTTLLKISIPNQHRMAVPIKEVQSFEMVKKHWKVIQANPEVLGKRQNGGLKPHAQQANKKSKL